LHSFAGSTIIKSVKQLRSRGSPLLGRENFMRLSKKIAAFALSALLLLGIGSPAVGKAAARAGAFRDVPADSWCAEAVAAMNAGGLIRGYADGGFHPNATMSVGAFVTVAARCAGTDFGADESGYWCGATAAEAQNANWLPSSFTGSVTPAVYNRPVTRETAVCVLMRGLWPQSKHLGYTAASIPDNSAIAPDVRADILAAYNAGVTTGSADGRFDPAATLTRAQAAVLLYRAGFVQAADTTVASGASGCEVDYLDVGQADAILVRCDGHNMLIDGGNTGDSSLIYAYLKKYDVTHLDYMVNTHPHEDHVGGLSGALHAAAVDTVYAPTASYDSGPFNNFVKYVHAQGKEITVPAPGSTFALGGAQVQVVGPQKTDYTDLNDTSIVLRMTYGDVSFLFTGDAGEKSEYDMIQSGLPLQSTVLKVGHHGSATASSYAFLRSVAPKYAVISCGVHNDYGHPTKSVLSRLRDAGAQVYRTDMQGVITAVSDGKTVTFSTGKNPNANTNPTETDGSGQNAKEVAYIGNLSSKKFHRSTCTSLPAQRNQVLFASRAAAVAAGYTPCHICNP
jgi:competence protein ComEC